MRAEHILYCDSSDMQSNIIHVTRICVETGRRYVDFPITDVLQMMGRAGRPQYDQHGVAVIMVADAKKSFYKKAPSRQNLTCSFCVPHHTAPLKLLYNLAMLLLVLLCQLVPYAVHKRIHQTA